MQDIFLKITLLIYLFLFNIFFQNLSFQTRGAAYTPVFTVLFLKPVSGQDSNQKTNPATQGDSQERKRKEPVTTIEEVDNVMEDNGAENSECKLTVL